MTAAISGDGCNDQASAQPPDVAIDPTEQSARTRDAVIVSHESLPDHAYDESCRCTGSLPRVAYRPAEAQLPTDLARRVERYPSVGR